MSNRRSIPAASAAGVRGRAHHTLAPAHLGEATAAAVVAVVVGGIAMVITGIGMVALALTTGARYGGSPPPDVASLAIGPALGGLGFIALGGALTAGGVAVLGAVRRARQVTGVLAALTAALAALGNRPCHDERAAGRGDRHRPHRGHARLRGRRDPAAAPRR